MPVPVLATDSAKPPPILRDLPEELVGPRLVVRPLRPGDGPALWEAVEESREHLRPWIDWADKHQTRADSEAIARRLHAAWLTREDLPVALIERATGRYLGGSGLHRVQWDVPAFEIGYWVRKSAEGQGFVTEAVRLLCALCFDSLGANRVEIRCDSNNTRSAAIPHRLGFVHEATLRNAARDPQGNLRDTLIFALTPKDYRASQEERITC